MRPGTLPRISYRQLSLPSHRDAKKSNTQENYKTAFARIKGTWYPYNAPTQHETFVLQNTNHAVVFSSFFLIRQMQKQLLNSIRWKCFILTVCFLLRFFRLVFLICHMKNYWTQTQTESVIF